MSERRQRINEWFEERKGEERMTQIDAVQFLDTLKANADNHDYNPKWWSFEVKRIEDSPYFCVSATNRISGDSHKLFVARDVRKLYGSPPYSSEHVNNAVDACCHIMRRIEAIERRLFGTAS